MQLNLLVLTTGIFSCMFLMHLPHAAVTRLPSILQRGVDDIRVKPKEHSALLQKVEHLGNIIALTALPRKQILFLAERPVLKRSSVCFASWVSPTPTSCTTGPSLGGG